MFEDMKPNNLDNNEIMPQYSEAGAKKEVEETNELDVLYKNIGRNFTRSHVNKTPGVYYVVGFVSGVLFMLFVFGIVALSSAGVNKDNEIEVKTVQKVEQKVVENAPLPDADLIQEKYTIQKGDTLDKIVVRYYGQYSDEKIKEIQQINNIKNPARLQIGQVIILPSK